MTVAGSVASCLTDVVVLSLVALVVRLVAAPAIARLVGGLTTGRVVFAAAGASLAFSTPTASLPFPPVTVPLLGLLLVTSPVTSTRASLFLFTPASSFASAATVFALEATVDAVARVVAEVAVVAPPRADFALDVNLEGRALAFSLSLVERTTRVVLLTCVSA